MIFRSGLNPETLRIMRSQTGGFFHPGLKNSVKLCQKEGPSWFLGNRILLFK